MFVLRLKHDKHGGAWCPRGTIHEDARVYLEVSLSSSHQVVGVQTQGRHGNGAGIEFTKEYWLEYQRRGSWVVWKNKTGQRILTGNNNTNDIVEQRLEPFIVTDKIRVFPYSAFHSVICMRIELIGCPWKLGLLSYSMHQGASRGTEVNLSDRTYDGISSDGFLSGGLGQLTDGQRGHDNFRADSNGFGKGYEWIGWRNDTLGRYVEIIFEFSEVKNFTALLLHTSNMFSKDVQVPSYGEVFFSLVGSQYRGSPLHFSYMPDLVMEHARDVTIKLHNRLGRRLKLHLYFTARWIMISEVNFDCNTAVGNFTEEELIETTTDQATVSDRDDLNQIGSSGNDPFQRDDVHTTPGRQGAGGQGTGFIPPPDASSPDEGSQAALVGTLVAVALLLMAAIALAATRGRRDATPSNTNTPRVVANKNDKEEATYHEPYNFTGYRGHGSSPKVLNPCVMPYGEIPCGQGPARPPPPRFTAAHAPPVPPPPERYYAAPDSPPPLNPPPKAERFSTSVKAERFPASAKAERYYAEDSPPPSKPPSRSRQTTTKGGYSLPASLSSTSGVGDSAPDEDEYQEQENMKIPTIPWKNLKILQTLGEGRFGPVHICEVEGECPLETGQSVFVQSLKTACSPAVRAAFDRHVRALVRLRDPNLGRAMAANRETEPFSVIIEHISPGDLNQFLQSRVAESANTAPLAGKTLSYGCLIYMATQIASGMKYLESLNVIHRDLATRNCMVGKSYAVKICDLGIGKVLYPADYYRLEDKTNSSKDDQALALPIRWMAWESVLLDKCSVKSDVWSFAVTLWEILTFAREQPFEDMADDHVIANLTHVYRCTGEQVILDCPIKCPKEIYDLMCECWRREESDRPSFREIHLFLQRKNLGFNPEAN